MINTQSISKNHIVHQVGGSIVSDMGGEKVMLSIRQGKYYNLGDIGGEIWEQIEQPMSVKDLITALIDKFDVSESECEHQVISFLDHLKEEGLVQIEEA